MVSLFSKYYPVGYFSGSLFYVAVLYGKVGVGPSNYQFIVIFMVVILCHL